MNLLEETITCIESSGHTPANIVFIGSEESGHQCTWEEFTKLANREYKDGFGAAQVSQDLIIVFSDGMKMWRGEYDGSEWWEFSTPFKMPQVAKPITTLFAKGIGWIDLKDINK